MLRLLLVFIFPISLIAQDPYHILYGIDDGLPSEEVYDVYVDDNDVIWTTTDRGVSTFDSYSFTNYSTADGLACNTNFKILPDKTGKLWFTGYDGSMSIFEEGVFRKSPYSDTLQSLINNRFYYDLINDNDGNIYITYAGGEKNLSSQSYLKIDTNGILTEELFSNSEKITRTGSYLSVEEINVGKESILKTSPFGYVPLTPLDYGGGKKIFIIPLYILNIDKSIYKKSAYQLYVYDDRGVEPFLMSSANFNNVGIDTYSNVIICTNDGILIYRRGDFDNEPDHYFKGREFSDFTQDNSGNYWFSSQKDGLYFIPSFESEIISISTLDKNISDLIIHDDHLFFKSGFMSVNYIDSNYRNITVTAFDGRAGLSAEANQESKELVKVNGKYYCESEKNKLRIINPSVQLLNGDTLTVGNDFRVNSGAETLYSSEFAKNPTRSRITAFRIFDYDIYYSTLRSFFVVRDFDYHNAEKFQDSKGLLNTRISDFVIDKDGNQWISTVGNGILYRTNDNQVIQFGASNGLSSNLYNTLYFQNDSTLWLGSNSGLERVVLDINQAFINIKEVSHFNVRDGLLSNYINSIIFLGDKIWVGSKEGLQGLPLNMQPKLKPPKVIIEEFVIKDSIFQRDVKPILQYDQNDIVIKYKGVSYDRPNGDFYRFSLATNVTRSGWSYTNDRSTRYTNLDPGNYVFSICASNKNGVWSEPEQFAFIVKPHFTSTWWFRILAILSFLALIYYFYLRHVAKLVKKNETERVLAESKLKVKIAELSTFKNQFNPHFIFNSLNSIQNFMIDRDVWQANLFLSNFAALIRKSLNLIDKKMVPLAKEIEFLKSYLELEFLRFPDKFDYEINNDSDLPLEYYMIPPLLMQPVVENVVKHAFKGKDRGKLNIIIIDLEAENAISVTIADNGKGIQNEEYINSKSNKSFGMKIVNDRIKLLNIKHSTSIASFEVVNNKNGKGTQATFIIPKITLLDV